MIAPERPTRIEDETAAPRIGTETGDIGRELESKLSSRPMMKRPTARTKKWGNASTTGLRRRLA